MFNYHFIHFTIPNKGKVMNKINIASKNAVSEVATMVDQLTLNKQKTHHTHIHTHVNELNK